MVDDFEKKHGGPVDRSEFDGEFIVPPEIRNRANSLNSRRSLLNISRSRTFLTLPINNSRNTMHGSVPDLSRSVPNTPNTNHKLSLASSYDSVLEEVEPTENGAGDEKQPNKVVKPPPPPPSAIKYIFTDDGVHLRRKSEDILSRTPLSRLPENKNFIAINMNVTSNKRSPIGGRSAITSLPPPSPLHVRQNSEPMNRLIPVRAHLRKPTNFIEGMTNRTNVSSFLSSRMPQQEAARPRNSSSSSLYNIHAIAQGQQDQRGGGHTHGNGLSTAASLSPSKWGNVRTSNSFSSNLSVNSISSYTIPRVSLQAPKLTLNDNNNKNSPSNDVADDDSAA
jgi:hypothetical protein